jgi:glutaredoxin
MRAVATGLLLLIVACLACPQAQAQLYKWTDEQGRIHYSDQAPDQDKAKAAVIKIESYTGPAVVSTLEKSAPAAQANQPTAAKGRIKLLTTSWCGYCRQARAYLNSRGIPFEDLDVEKSAQGKQEYRELNGRGVPIILVGNQRMNGYSQAQLDTMLRTAGH